MYLLKCYQFKQGLLLYVNLLYHFTVSCDCREYYSDYLSYLISEISFLSLPVNQVHLCTVIKYNVQNMS